MTASPHSLPRSPRAAPLGLPAGPARGRLAPRRFRIADGGFEIEVLDFTPRFLDFHAAARDADPQRRWQLWQERYGFAAVPPTAQGLQLARQLLERAWPAYAAVLPRVRAGFAALQPSPLPVLRRVARLLGLQRPISVQLALYVGAFEGNAFAAGDRERPLVAIPIEAERSRCELLMPHEFAHAVHMVLAGLRGGWQRSVAETVLQEGIALHVTRLLAPGRPVREYIEHCEGWFDDAMAHAPAILEAIEPVLGRSDADTVYRFLVGQGATGRAREAYVAGWVAVAEMMRRGLSLACIARIPPAEMVQAVATAIRR